MFTQLIMQMMLMLMFMLIMMMIEAMAMAIAIVIMIITMIVSFYFICFYASVAEVGYCLLEKKFNVLIDPQKYKNKNTLIALECVCF